MQAKVGDRIVIKGHRIGEPDRDCDCDCEVLEAHGPDGPYLVGWGESGHETLLLPGLDAAVEKYEQATERSSDAHD